MAVDWLVDSACTPQMLYPMSLPIFLRDSGTQSEWPIKTVFGTGVAQL